MSASPYANSPVRKFQTFAGTICEGMKVVSATDEEIGTVETVRGGQIVLKGGDGKGGELSVPLGMIDGIGEGRVLLSDRGDASFGLGAAP